MKDYLLETMCLVISIICLSWFFASTEPLWIRYSVVGFGIIVAYIYNSLLDKQGAPK